jgi:hypothetical protein
VIQLDHGGFLPNRFLISNPTLEANEHRKIYSRMEATCISETSAVFNGLHARCVQEERERGGAETI